MNELTSAQTDCAFTRANLTALLDEELSPEDTATVRAHLNECLQCQQERNALTQFAKRLSGWRVPESDISARTLQAVDRESPFYGIRPADLERARTVQQQTGEHLVGILVRLGLAPSSDIVQALARVDASPFIDLGRHKPEASAVLAVSARLAWKNRILPVRLEGNILWVACADPRNTDAIDAVRAATQTRVRPLVAALPDLERALADAYGPEIGSAQPVQALQPPASPPSTDTALAAILEELRALRGDLRDARAELSALRGEVADLRRQPVTPRRTEGARLMPYAAPTEMPLYPGGHSFS